MFYVLTLLLWILRGSDAREDKKKSISEIVDIVGDSILTVSEGGKILSLNKFAEEKLCLSGELDDAVTLSQFLSSDGMAEGVEPSIRHMLDSGKDVDLSVLDGRTIKCRVHKMTGGHFSAELSVSMSSTRGRTQYTCVIKDITEKQKAEQEIERLNYTDPLTGLANRKELYRRLDIAIKSADRNKTNVSVMLLDLDNFKQINDTFGHDVGDGILKVVGERLHDCGREVDTIARLGGDEFVFIATGLLESTDSNNPAERIVEKLKVPILIDGYEHLVGTSIGISLYPQDDATRAELFRKADVALYKAKQKGLGVIQFYNSQLDEDVRGRKMMEDDLRRAMENREMSLNYQPQLSFGGDLIGVEALLRWKRADGYVSPEVFISIAENCGLIGELGDWVLEEACKQAKTWQDAGLSNLRMAVNISAIQFSDEKLIDTVSRVLSETGLNAKYLELEITESMLMEDVDQTIEKLKQLREMGVALAIDDFGTGHSSLAYLKSMPVDRLKIDRSFIQAIPGEKGDEAIVEAILKLGQTLELEIVAEGVETIGQLAFLEGAGCDIVQGYYFSKPLSVANFEQWSAGRGHSPAADLQEKLNQN
jgi:diguanylate cyclase (GGDEF)-like protein/PAS domain S-box-containing protein